MFDATEHITSTPGLLEGQDLFSDILANNTFFKDHVQHDNLDELCPIAQSIYELVFNTIQESNKLYTYFDQKKAIAVTELRELQTKLISLLDNYEEKMNNLVLAAGMQQYAGDDLLPIIEFILCIQGNIDNIASIHSPFGVQGSEAEFFSDRKLANFTRRILEEQEGEMETPGAGVQVKLLKRYHDCLDYMSQVISGDEPVNSSSVIEHQSSLMGRLQHCLTSWDVVANSVTKRYYPDQYKVENDIQHRRSQEMYPQLESKEEGLQNSLNFTNILTDPNWDDVQLTQRSVHESIHIQPYNFQYEEEQPALASFDVSGSKIEDFRAFLHTRRNLSLIF
jgi:hypothetical protein